MNPISELPEASQRELWSFQRYLQEKADAIRRGAPILPRYELWREEHERWDMCADCGSVTLQIEPGFDCAMCGCNTPDDKRTELRRSSHSTKGER